MATKPLVTIKQNPSGKVSVTTAETQDGNRYTFAGDNWIKYAEDNNITSPLSKAISYPAYVTANEANNYLNNTAMNATMEAKANDPNATGILGSTFGAGVYDTVSKKDLIDEYNRKYPNNQLNYADYGISADSTGGTNYNYVPSTGSTGSYGNYGTYDYNYGTGSTGSFGSSSYPSYQSLSYDELYDMYKGISDQQTAGALGILNSLTNRYIGYEDELNQSVDKANKDAYVNYKMQQKNMPQQMSANGLTGGLSESSLIGLRSNYGNTVAENERARQSQLNDLRGDKEEMAAQIAQTIAGYDAQAAQNAASAFLNAIQAENAYNQWVYEMEYARTQAEREYAMRQAEIARENELAAKSEWNGYLDTMLNTAIATKDTNMLNNVLALMGTNYGGTALTSNGWVEEDDGFGSKPKSEVARVGASLGLTNELLNGNI